MQRPAWPAPCRRGGGIAADTLERIDALINAGVDVVIVDTAHGHQQGVLDMVKRVRAKYSIELVAGNIATAEAARDLIRLDIDAVKVGIGPGSICTTRIVAGVGVPQVTAILECAKVASKARIPLIADGGIKQTGDVAKAIAAGADSVMVGGLFAGVEESPGEKILYEGRSYKIYRGMGSLAAMKQGSERYFQDAEDDIQKLVPEGIEGRVPFKGALSDTVYQMTGGLHAAMGYCGCRTIAEFKKKARFIKMTDAGLRESHPHDIHITKEAPNLPPLTDMIRTRLNAVRRFMQILRLDAFIVTDLSHVFYLTGFTGSSGLCVITPQKQFFVTDNRYKAQAPLEVHGFQIVIAPLNLFQTIADKRILPLRKRIGFESQVLHVSEFRSLKKLFPSCRFIPTADIIETISAVKDASEIALLRAAVDITDKTFRKKSYR